MGKICPADDGTGTGPAAGTWQDVTATYTTGPSVTTSLLRKMVGISVRSTGVANQTIGGDDPAYAANAGFEFMKRGRMIVAKSTSETWTRNDEVYVILTAGSTAGTLTDTAAADCVWLPKGRLCIDRGESSTTTDGVGVIRLDMGA